VVPEYLDRILEHKRKVLTQQQSFFASLKKRMDGDRGERYRIFEKAIAKPGRLNLIAEIKKASPSKGVIRERFDLLAIAKTYAEHGADAISVLTEDKYFLGKPAYVKSVSGTCRVPVLTKDFIIDEGQLYEARYNGASAVLLIVAILNDAQLKALHQKAGELDLDCLVEVHDEKELQRALAADARIIGINNRDLKTFAVDLKVTERLIPKVPKGKIIVAESGIATHADTLRLKKAGANAVLIGEAFMAAEDIGLQIEKIMKGY
jgi:indole-3-glycerol phosphate synthase